jgi:hypothetical protein
MVSQLHQIFTTTTFFIIITGYPLKIFFHGINKKQSVLVDSLSDGDGFVWFQHTWLSRLLFSQTLWRNGGSVTVINGGRNRQTNIL